MAEALVPNDEVHLHNGTDNQWKLIGELIEIFTYAIDTGFGFSTSSANVTKFGMNSMNFAQMTFMPMRLYHFKMHDRTLIPFKDTMPMLFNSQVEEIRHTTIINELDMARRVDLPKTVHYLGHPTDVYRIDTNATKYHIEMSKDITIKLPCDFAYLPQGERCDNFDKFIQKSNEPHEINNGYLANYSPFMLINKKSLDALREETGRTDLSTSHLRPNFVIDATPPYCEEDITELKIGPLVEFRDIIPCSHNFTKIVSKNEEGEVKTDMLFDIFQRRKQTVNAKYPHQKAFGINMQAKVAGEVEVGHKVYAKFNKKPEDLNL